MNEAAKQRAEIVGARPDVQRWIRRLARLAKDMPPDVWVFVASGTPCVMALQEDGERFTHRHRGIDRESEITSVAGGTWDGGDF